jgi:hypothetical protein
MEGWGYSLRIEERKQTGKSVRFRFVLEKNKKEQKYAKGMFCLFYEE